jgi:hypothetical protein
LLSTFNQSKQRHKRGKMCQLAKEKRSDRSPKSLYEQSAKKYHLPGKQRSSIP